MCKEEPAATFFSMPRARVSSSGFTVLSRSVPCNTGDLLCATQAEFEMITAKEVKQKKYTGKKAAVNSNFSQD